MHRGYVKVWRKSIDSGWLHNPNLWTFWCWCLLKASHKEMDMMVGYQNVHLMPGEFIFGRHAASKELKMSERKIRTNLHYLGISQNVTIKTTNKFSVISIVNWATYQADETTNDHQNDQPVTRSLPAHSCTAAYNTRTDFWWILQWQSFSWITWFSAAG